MKWRLRKPEAKAAPVKKSVRHYERLHDIGPVKTVIDVGVGDNGSPFLYEAFPDAYFYSIDPVAEVLLIAPASGVNGLLIPAACGGTDSTVDFDVSAKPSRTSLAGRRRVDTRSERSELRSAPVVTLDALMGEGSINIVRPCLLKIDVEGYELTVLSGMKAMSRGVDYVMIEVSFGTQYDDEIRPSQLVAELASMGFQITGVMKCGIDTCDLLFARSQTDS